MIRHSLFFLLAALAAACAAEQDLGSRGASGAALSKGEPCSCNYEGCCAEGLICDECEVTAGGGTSCSYSGSAQTPDRKCRPARPDGTICTSQLQCASGVCSKSGDETVFHCGSSSSSTGLDPGRCRESLDCTDGRVCVDSYCKKARGERCDASSECASNKCYGTSPLDYACL